jgi:hypothetical protein
MELGYLGVGASEGKIGRLPCDLDQQLVQGGLAIVVVRSKIRQIPPFLHRHWAVHIRVNRAPERFRRPGRIVLPQLIKCRPAGEGQIQIETRDQRRRKIPVAAGREFPQCHGRIDVIEHDRTAWIPNRACAEAMLRSSGFEIMSRPEKEVYLCRRAAVPYGACAVYPVRAPEEREP